jgi:hypothetical protein
MFRYHSVRYEAVVENPTGVCRAVTSVEVDGLVLEGEGGGGATGAAIPLADDGLTHDVSVVG